MAGRPTDYTPELANRLCEEIAIRPENLTKILASSPDYPTDTTLRKWRWKYPDFQEKYLEAKKMQSQMYVEQIVDLADEPCDSPHEVTQRKLQIETRRWLASKLSQGIYGDAKQKDDESEQRLKDAKTILITMADILNEGRSGE